MPRALSIRTVIKSFVRIKLMIEDTIVGWDYFRPSIFRIINSNSAILVLVLITVLITSFTIVLTTFGISSTWSPPLDPIAKYSFMAQKMKLPTILDFSLAEQLTKNSSKKDCWQISDKKVSIKL